MWVDFDIEVYPQVRKEIFMNVVTASSVKVNRQRNTFLIPVVLLVILILAGFLAYSTQRKPEPVALSTISQGVLEKQYGLHVNLVAVTAAGGLVDVRLKMIDGEKAKSLLQDPESFPTLQIPGSQLTLIAPEEGRPAEISFEDDSNLFLMYPNTANTVRPGTLVSIRFGDIQVEPIPAK